ncbi:XRE family transcriptional regulator [Antribacter gilvus]|uniref:XRE family transcriptional regulator n=1 Tax=Antribacter gilvus TaxID=2304675 RepID=UPI000F78FFB1|nr:XRE family transcriptional regulator [Antribacter gilvus]
MDTNLPTRVREAIAETGLTHAEFAARVRMTADKLSKSLNGSRRFTTLELALIADASGTTVDWLINGTVVEQPAMAARTVLKSGQSKQEIESFVEHFMTADRQLQKLRGRRELTPLPVGPPPEGAEAYVPQVLATYAADRLAALDRNVDGLTTADLIEAIRQAFDVDTVVDTLPGGLDGFAWQTSTLRILGVRRTPYWARQRFTLAHELGHILMHQAKDLLAENETNGQKPPGERAADQFAAHFLMPERALRDAASSGHLERHTAIDLINRLLVSPAAFSWRAYNLGLISASEREELAVLTAEICAVLGDRADLVYQARTASEAQRLPRRLVVGHISAYQEGETSARPLANLLGVPVQEVVNLFGGGDQEG